MPDFTRVCGKAEQLHFVDAMRLSCVWREAPQHEESFHHSATCLQYEGCSFHWRGARCLDGAHHMGAVACTELHTCAAATAEAGGGFRHAGREGHLCAIRRFRVLPRLPCGGV
jgi:hypothetical protein